MGRVTSNPVQPAYFHIGAPQLPKNKEKFKMAVEEARRDLQHRLEEVLGKEHALTLMAALPPNEAATKADIEALRLATKGEIEALRLATKGDFDDVRNEMREMEARLNERIDLKVEASEHRMISALERGLGDLRKEMVSQTRVFVFSTLTAVIASSGLAVAAGRFS